MDSFENELLFDSRNGTPVASASPSPSIGTRSNNSIDLLSPSPIPPASPTPTNNSSSTATNNTSANTTPPPNPKNDFNPPSPQLLSSKPSNPSTFGYPQFNYDSVSRSSVNNNPSPYSPPPTHLQSSPTPQPQQIPPPPSFFPQQHPQAFYPLPPPQTSIYPTQQFSQQPPQQQQQQQYQPPAPLTQQPQQQQQQQYQPPAPQSNGIVLKTTGINGSIFDPPELAAQKQQQTVIHLLEGLQSKFEVVFQRLDGVESRLSSLEIATKEVLNNQRNLQVQQRKLQDVVERDNYKTTTTSGYDDVKKPTATPNPVYIPPPSLPMPGAGYPAPHMPPPMHSLVPVTQIRDHGHVGDQQYKSDLELAKKLQAAFDQEQKEVETPKPSSLSSSASIPKITPTSQQQECPICQVKVAIGDLEAHVEQHFEDEEGRRARAGKDIDKNKDGKDAPKSLFSKLFGPKDAPVEEKKTETTTPTSTNKTTSSSQDTPHSTSSASPSLTSTNNPANMYPYMARGGYALPYGQPGGVAGQYRAPYFPTPYPAAQMQRLPPPQGQFLYYPPLDQNPQ